MLQTPLILLITIAFSGLMSFLKVPTPEILICLVFAVAGDLITGLLKSWATGVATKSTGFRASILKILVYVATTLAVIVLVSLIGLVDRSKSVDLKIVIDALVSAMVFIEVYSMFENISEAYPKAPITRYFINPVLKALKGRLEQNKQNIQNHDHSSTVS